MRTINLLPVCPICNKKDKIGKKKKQPFFFCSRCLIGFVHPIPANLNEFYHSNYWNSSSFIGNLKNFIFSVFQKRRNNWVKKNFKKAQILDVGAGEGRFATFMSKNYKVTSLERENSKIANNKVIKTDFLEWKTNKKFNAVCFWESLEHVENPQAYLSKAQALLVKGGKIFIEFPRYDCLESRIFGKNWFHLDIPRHLIHLSNKGTKQLLEGSGFKNIEIKSVFSPDYAIWGFTASLLNYITDNTTDNLKQSKGIFILFLLIPILLLSSIIETILFFLNESPIALAIAEKND